jgi:hypothetical protein
MCLIWVDNLINTPIIFYLISNCKHRVMQDECQGTNVSLLRSLFYCPQLPALSHMWRSNVQCPAGTPDGSRGEEGVVDLIRGYLPRIFKFAEISISGYFPASLTKSISSIPFTYLSKKAGMITFIISIVLFPSIGPIRARTIGTG